MDSFNAYIGLPISRQS